MNPYESPQTDSVAQTVPSQRLDRGVLLIAMVMGIGCLTSIASIAFPPLQDFLMPRFGWVGLMACMNSLIFIAFWAKAPSRSALFAVTFMTCAIGLINAWRLLQSGTVDVIENPFHDRVHSAWIWSVGSYLLAGVYTAAVAIRTQNVSPASAPGQLKEPS